MTIEREYFEGPITFVCDICGDKDETHATNFPGAYAKYKSHGGKAVKVKDEWEHHCSSCQ